MNIRLSLPFLQGIPPSLQAIRNPRYAIHYFLLAGQGIFEVFNRGLSSHSGALKNRNTDTKGARTAPLRPRRKCLSLATMRIMCLGSIEVGQGGMGVLSYDLTGSFGD
jgi:hypothetical protein